MLPAAALCRRKGKISGSPGFAKPGADQRLDPPALFAVTATPLAFGMIGDFSLRIAEEIPIPGFFQMFTSSLVFQGGLPPAFSADFRPVSGFSEAGGILTLPQMKKRHTGGSSGFYWFYIVWVVCVLQVCFQLHKQIPQAPQRFFRFAIRCTPATHQRQKNVFQMQAAAVPHLCHGKRNANSAAGATTFPFLPHLPHMIFTRLPLQ